MELSRRETFDQLRADRRQSEIFLQEHIQRLELREDERKGGGPLPRTLAMVEEEEGTTMMVVEGAINLHKDNLHQSRFQSSRGRMIQTST